MMIKILWWHVPTVFTFGLLLYMALPTRSALDDYAKIFVVAAGIIIVLAVWLMAALLR